MVQIDFLRRVRHTETKPFGDSIRGKLNIEPRPSKLECIGGLKKMLEKRGKGRKMMETSGKEIF